MILNTSYCADCSIRTQSCAFFFFFLDIPFNCTHIHHIDLPTKTNKQPSKHEQIVTRHAHVHIGPYNDSTFHEWIDGQAM